jgi:hypothetical protein
MTRKINKLFLLAVLFTSVCSCSPELYQANRQLTPIYTDGILSEWNLPLRYVDGKSGLQFNITNDSHNLYLCFRATDRATEMQILASGIEIKIDPKGKKNYTASLHFPWPSREEKSEVQFDFGSEKLSGGNADASNGENRNKPSGHADFQQHPRNYKIMLSGFNPEYNGIFDARDCKQVLAAARRDSLGILSCEFTIPFNSFSRMNLQKIGKPSVLGLDIAINALKSPGRHPGSGQREGGEMGEGRSSSGMGGMNGMGHMGGSHGGHMGGSMGGRSGNTHSGQSSFQNREDISIKMRVSLNSL